LPVAFTLEGLMHQHKSKLERIRERVRKKRESYTQYNFERLQEEAFASFFDLAQEYTTLDNLYLVCVLVPKEFFDLDARLYLLDEEGKSLKLMCSSIKGLEKDSAAGNPEVTVQESPYFTDDSYIIPIRGKSAAARLSFQRETIQTCQAYLSDIETAKVLPLPCFLESG
jgi:hypothetical protein